MNMLFLEFAALAAATQPAADPAPQPSPQAVFACRTLPDVERLRCYDRTVAAMQAAVASGSVAIVNREELQRARRSLFGLKVPSMPLLNRSGGEEQAKIETTIRAVRPFERGKWEIVLADGAVWQTTEEDTRSIDPRAGAVVTIGRGSLGSYILTWRGGRPQRAKRVS